MPTKELPEDRVALEHLLTVLRTYSAALGPIRNQVRELVTTAADLMEGDTSDYPHLTMVMASLREKLADGLPPVGILADYLGPDDAFPSPKVTGSVLDHVKQLARVWTANGYTEEQVTALAAHQIANFRDAIEDHAERVEDLERRLIARIELHARGDGPTDARSPEAEDTGKPTPARSGSTTGRKRSEVAGRFPEIPLERRAIAYDAAKKRWVLFEKYWNGWRCKGEMKPQLPAGVVTKLLLRFAETAGALTPADVLAVTGGRGDIRKRNAYRVKTYIHRLRAWLRVALGLPETSDPVPWGTTGKRYLLKANLGYAERDDNGDSQLRLTVRMEG